jgi:hypothetical protein
MSQFRDKNVCLVLSCDRPYYRKRRESNYDTYRWFQQNGFSVVFLFAGVEGDEPKLSENTDGTYTLRVPSLEVYELLSHKMELAYKFFSKSGCTGIYWVSSNVIKHLANDGLEYIYEDASVGYVVNNHVELTKVFIPSAFGSVVMWYNDTES